MLEISYWIFVSFARTEEKVAYKSKVEMQEENYCDRKGNF